jgi:hypothetical protein
MSPLCVEDIEIMLWYCQDNKYLILANDKKHNQAIIIQDPPPFSKGHLKV